MKHTPGRDKKAILQFRHLPNVNNIRNWMFSIIYIYNFHFYMIKNSRLNKVSILNTKTTRNASLLRKMAVKSCRRIKTYLKGCCKSGNRNFKKKCQRLRLQRDNGGNQKTSLRTVAVKKLPLDENMAKHIIEWRSAIFWADNTEFPKRELIFD